MAKCLYGTMHGSSPGQRKYPGLSQPLGAERQVRQGRVRQRALQCHTLHGHPVKAKTIVAVRLMEKGHQQSPGKSPDHSHPLKLYSACMTATGPVHDLSTDEPISHGISSMRWADSLQGRSCPECLNEEHDVQGLHYDWPELSHAYAGAYMPRLACGPEP